MHLFGHTFDHDYYFELLRVGGAGRPINYSSFLPSGQDQWSEATLNFTVTTGDRIYTDKDARAELQVGVLHETLPFK